MPTCQRTTSRPRRADVPGHGRHLRHRPGRPRCGWRPEGRRSWSGLPVAPKARGSGRRGGGAHGGPAEHVPLDLADLDSVRACAGRSSTGASRSHVLVNNAGVAASRGATAQGFELTFGVNHLGHFLLTTLLLDGLGDGAPRRVVSLASKAHFGAKGVDFDALRRPTRTRTGLVEYQVAKLCNVLFTPELARRRPGRRGRGGAPRGDRLRHLAPGAVARSARPGQRFMRIDGGRRRAARCTGPPAPTRPAAAMPTATSWPSRARSPPRSWPPTCGAAARPGPADRDWSALSRGGVRARPDRLSLARRNASTWYWRSPATASASTPSVVSRPSGSPEPRARRRSAG